MRRLFPLLLALFGLGVGVAAGLVLKPQAEAVALPDEGEGAEAAPEEAPAASPDDETADYVRLNNQFVVPVVDDGRVRALVVLSVSLQVSAGGRETVFSREPKLRDSFLQVLFDHANAGGFDGGFTTSGNLRTLRGALLEAARRVLGDMVGDVLIIDMMRQDT